MFRKSLFFLALCFSFVLVANPVERVTLVGFIEASQDDEEGGTTELYLFTEDDESFLIKTSGKGAEMHNHVGEKVKITGDIAEDDTGVWELTVVDFEILQED